MDNRERELNKERNSLYFKFIFGLTLLFVIIILENELIANHYERVRNESLDKIKYYVEHRISNIENGYEELDEITVKVTKDNYTVIVEKYDYTAYIKFDKEWNLIDTEYIADTNQVESNVRTFISIVTFFVYMALFIHLITKDDKKDEITKNYGSEKFSDDDEDDILWVMKQIMKQNCRN